MARAQAAKEGLITLSMELDERDLKTLVERCRRAYESGTTGNRPMQPQVLHLAVHQQALPAVISALYTPGARCSHGAATAAMCPPHPELWCEWRQTVVPCTYTACSSHVSSPTTGGL